MLWIDGVGGYLLIDGQRWSLGGPSGNGQADISIQSELSRQACQIVQHASDFVLQPFSQTALLGKSLDGPGLLRDGDSITLGACVELKFRRPHPLSASARLDIVSGHRTWPQCNAIILMVDTCVIGPAPGNHIHCPQWEHDVILFVNKEQWFVRSESPLTVNQREVGQRAQLSDMRHRLQIKSDTFSMTLEPV